LANWVHDKIGLKPEFAFGQWYHESAGFNSDLAKEIYNFGGMTQSEPNNYPQPGQDGSLYYKEFNSPEDWAEYYAWYITKCDGVKEAQTVPEFCQALKDNGYFGDSIDKYVNGISNGIAQIPGNYDSSLIDTSKFGKRDLNGKSGSNSNSNNSKKKNTGIFGQLAEISETLGSAFTVEGSSSGSTNNKQQNKKKDDKKDDKDKKDQKDSNQQEQKDDKDTKDEQKDNSNQQEKTAKGKYGRGKWGRGYVQGDGTYVETDEDKENGKPAASSIDPYGDKGTQNQSEKSVNEQNENSEAFKKELDATNTNKPEVQAKAKTQAASTGLFGGILSQAKEMAGKIKKAMAPLASGIMSQASSFFGADKIKMIFGDDNPFSSIFGGNKKSSSSGSQSGSSGGKFVSKCTNEGIKKASDWAESVLDNPDIWYGRNGCTAFCQEYLRKAGNPFADTMSLNCDVLMSQAQSSGLWKTPEQGGCEGDIALLETDGNETPGPDHAVIYDGQGGCWGNSSGSGVIKYYPNMLDAFPQGLHGFIATGAGDNSTVAQSGGNKRSAYDAAADAGPTSGGGKNGFGKYGRGKFGLGQFTRPKINNTVVRGNLGLGKFIKRAGRGKYGRGSFSYSADEVAAYMNNEYNNDQDYQKAHDISVALSNLANTDPDSYNDIISQANSINASKNPTSSNKYYNQIQDSDSLDVANAKRAKIQELSSQGLPTMDGSDASKSSEDESQSDSSSNTNLPAGTPGFKSSEDGSIQQTVAKNIIDINAKPKTSQDSTNNTSSKTKSTPVNNIPNIVDYSSQLNTIISLLSTIASALTGNKVQPNAADNKSTSNASVPAPANILQALSSMGNGSNNGIGDAFANKDTASILSSMKAIAGYQ
jgi:hypothetical protein